MRSGRRSGLTCPELLVLGVLTLVWVALVLPAAMSSSKERASRTRCANSIRQLGLAAIQYSDDRRYFPHIAPQAELDGGPATGDGPRTVRALVWAGYHDNPEGFVCPQSEDRQAPVSEVCKADMRRWSWGGEARTDPATSPLHDGVADPVLLDTDELSYGWTRRGLNAFARSTCVLAVDRACRAADDGTVRRPGLVGNHPEGVNVLTVDASCRWVPGDDPALATLASVGSGGAALGVLPLAVDPSAFAADARRRRWEGFERAALPLFVLLAPPLLLALLLEVVGRLVRGRAPAPIVRVAPPPGAPPGGR